MMLSMRQTMAVATLTWALLSLSVESLAAPSMTCTPSRLHAGDVLTVRMAIPHGGDFGIWDPQRRFFFVSFWQPDKSSPAEQPVIDWKAFRNVSELTFPTETATAILWAGGPRVP